jgi:hypothetical protein
MVWKHYRKYSNFSDKRFRICLQMFAYVYHSMKQSWGVPVADVPTLGGTVGG